MLVSALLAPQTFTLMPTDDIWVYPHATDPAGDPFLRVWGVDGDAVPSSAEDADSFSMGYLKFSLAAIPKGLELASAKLVVHQLPPAGYTLEDAKAAPLEARLLSPKFAEKGWSSEVLATVLPKQDDLLGQASPDAIDGSTITISIDLMNDPARLKKALEESEIGIALTSTINAADLGRAAIYKIYSREEKDSNLVPKLVLEYK